VINCSHFQSTEI